MVKRLISVGNLGKVGFALAIVALLASLVEPAALWQLLANVSLPLFAVAVLIVLFDAMFMGLKWAILLKAFSVSVCRTVALPPCLRSRIFVYAAPSTLGVDTYKVYFLRHRPGGIVYYCRAGAGGIVVAGHSTVDTWFALQTLGVGSPFWISLAGMAGLLRLLLFIYLIIRCSLRLALLSTPGFLPARIKHTIGQLSENFSKTEGRESALWRYFQLSVAENLPWMRLRTMPLLVAIKTCCCLVARYSESASSLRHGSGGREALKDHGDNDYSFAAVTFRALPIHAAA